LHFHHASLSDDDIDEYERDGIQGDIRRTLDNILATQTAHTAALAGVTVQAAATLVSIPLIQPRLPASTPMFPFNTIHRSRWIGTMKKLSDLRGVSSSAVSAPKLWKFTVS
jgi:hypothetical protein